MTLYIDSNEPQDIQAKVISEIENRTSIDTEIKGLETGDFVFQDVAIERKEAGDLLSSITDRRLSEQTDRIAQDFQHGYVLVEGDPYHYEYSNLHPNSIVGTYASIVAKKDLKLMHVDNADQLAMAIAKIVDYHEKDDWDATQQMLKRTRAETEDVTVAMLSCIEGVSGEKARMIVDSYGRDISTLASMKEQKFKSIPGIGDTLSHRIKSALTGGVA